jgi:hypothetical protein
MILLTPHPGGLDYNLDQNSHYPEKIQSFDDHCQLAQHICFEKSG